MTYEETIGYLYERLPMFTRTGSAALKEGLGNIIQFCDKLHNPQNSFKSIHIAGTNGKGSTSHILAAVLQQAGYKTGLYTSPHLKDFRERIRVNGKMVPKKFVTEFVKNEKSFIEQIEPSFFEVTVAMAFEYFKQSDVEIAVIEVGLGGRLDSTNIITPILSLVTNISLDHTYLLGNTLPEIAKEKAGIIKPHVPVVIGEYDSATADVFIQKSTETESELEFASQQYKIEKTEVTASTLQFDIKKGSQLLYAHLALDLKGVYQQKNILTVIAAIEKLNELSITIHEKDMRYALENVKKLTGLSGRWQVLGNHPLIICDTGHNEAGIREVVQNIQTTPFKKLHMVVGMVKDKDIHTVLDILPTNAQYYFCAPALERALSADELHNLARTHDLKGKMYTSVIEAFNAAKSNAVAEDFIFVGGSTFVVAEVL